MRIVHPATRSATKWKGKPQRVRLHRKRPNYARGLRQVVRLGALLCRSVNVSRVPDWALFVVQALGVSATG